MKKPTILEQRLAVTTSQRDEAINRAQYLAERSEEQFKRAEQAENRCIELSAALGREQAQVADLTERLKRAERRLDQALETADNAALAAGSIARITHSLGLCIDALEVKVRNENKDNARKFVR
jgi:hypothetical protein